MKKVLLYFLPVALLVGSCARLEIENTDPDSGSSSGGGMGGGGNQGGPGGGGPGGH